MRKTRTQQWIDDFHKKNAFANKLEGAVQLDMARGLRTFKDSVTPEKIERAVASRTTDRLFKATDWQSLDGKLAPANKRVLGVAQDFADRSLEALPFGKEMRYDLKNPAFADYIKTKTGSLITLVQEDTRQNVRAAVRKAFTSGEDPRDVAARIKRGLGLNQRQNTALQNFTTRLVQQGAKPEDVHAQAGAYADRLLNYRAMMVARTEVRLAANAGEQAVWKHADSEGFLPPNAKRRWVVDGNPCPKICKPMNGVTVGIHEKWRLPDGRRVDLPTESHPHCFCIQSLDLGDFHPGFGGKRRR